WRCDRLAEGDRERRRAAAVRTGGRGLVDPLGAQGDERRRADPALERRAPARAARGGGVVEVVLLVENVDARERAARTERDARAIQGARRAPARRMAEGRALVGVALRVARVRVEVRARADLRALRVDDDGAEARARAD